jgi:hypothetical protein
MQGTSSAPHLSQTAAPRGARALGVAALGASLLIVVYWCLWYAGGRDLLASAHTPEYFAFESAFPAADAWLALCALIAGVQLLRARSSAIFWLFLTGGSGLYLFLMDVLFDLENGIYSIPKGSNGSPVVIEMIINAATLILSGLALYWAWKHRSWAASGLAG